MTGKELFDDTVSQMYATFKSNRINGYDEFNAFREAVKKHTSIFAGHAETSRQLANVVEHHVKENARLHCLNDVQKKLKVYRATDLDESFDTVNYRSMLLVLNNSLEK